MRTLLLPLAAMLVMPLWANADSITVNGRRYDNLYIRVTETHYYLCSPRDGSVRSVARRDETVSGFSRSDDSDRLRKQWLAMQTPNTGGKTATQPRIKPPAAVSTPGTEALRGGHVVKSDTGIPSLVIKGKAKRDPAREAARLRYIFEERARRAYLRAEQQRAWEQEQRRMETEAYQQYLRDLQLREQELRVEGLAQENAYRERLNVPFFGYFFDTPWRRVYHPLHGEDDGADGYDRTHDDAHRTASRTSNRDRSTRPRTRSSGEPRESGSGRTTH